MIGAVAESRLMHRMKLIVERTTVATKNAYQRNDSPIFLICTIDLSSVLPLLCLKTAKFFWVNVKIPMVTAPGRFQAVIWNLTNP